MLPSEASVDVTAQDFIAIQIDTPVNSSTPSLVNDSSDEENPSFHSCLDRPVRPPTPENWMNMAAQHGIYFIRDSSSGRLHWLGSSVQREQQRNPTLAVDLRRRLHQVYHFEDASDILRTVCVFFGFTGVFVCMQSLLE